jgi:gluconokinase
VGGRLAELPTPVVACSALRRVYRDRLRAAAPATVFVHLAAGAGLLAARLDARVHAFMPASLLDSQLATLEPLQADERGFAVDVRDSPEDLVDEIVARLAAGG